MIRKGDAGAAASEGRPARGNRLEGWKGIAAYLGVSVRTAQRFETEEGLPIHRTGAGRRSRIVAYRDELDAWRRDYDSRRKTTETSGGRPRSHGRLVVSLLAALIVAGWLSRRGLRRQTTPAEDPTHLEASEAAITVFNAAGEVAFVIPVDNVALNRYEAFNLFIGAGTRVSD